MKHSILILILIIALTITVLYKGLQETEKYQNNSYTPYIQQCQHDTNCNDDEICINYKCEKIVTDIKPEWKACNEDSDCVETEPAGCPCWSGGGQTAINKNYVDFWLRNKNRNPGPTICLEVIKCRKASPVCVNKTCELKFA